MKPGTAILRVSLLTVLVLLPVGVASRLSHNATDEVRFSAYGSGPDALTSLREAALSAGFHWRTIVTGPAALDVISDPERTVYLAVAVQTPYTRDDIDALLRFASRGGHLFIAETGPGSNPLLARLGLAVSDQTILETDSQRPPWITAQLNLTSISPQVLVLRPAALVLPNDFSGRILAQTSPQSFLDVDGDNQSTTEDLPGPFPIVAILTRPQGVSHIVSSDLSLILPSSLPAETAGTLEAALGFLHHLLARGGTVIIDESRHHLPPPEAAAYRILATIQRLAADPSSQWILLAMAILGLTWTLSRPREDHWHRHEATPRINPWPGPPPDIAALHAQLARTLLAQKANFPPAELASIPSTQLSPMVIHDPPLHAALQGTATDKDWRELEARLISPESNPPQET